MRVALLVLLLLAPALAESDVLDRFLGEWNTEVQIVKDGVQKSARGKATGSRTLGGNWVEFRGQSLDPAGEFDLQVMTFDETSGLYRQWLFDSSGYRHEAVGEWDPATQVLTWRGKLGDNQILIHDRFLEGERLEWDLVETTPEGSEVREVKGVVSRPPPADLSTARWSGDGRYLVTTDGPMSMQVWDGRYLLSIGGR